MWNEWDFDTWQQVLLLINAHESVFSWNFKTILQSITLFTEIIPNEKKIYYTNGHMNATTLHANWSGFDRMRTWIY